MQGSGNSSLSIWTAFDAITTAFSRILKFIVKISWKRVESATSYAVVGSATVNGIYIVQGLSSIVTSLDNFVYMDETDKVVSLSYDRVLQEPLGGIAQSVLDIELDNTDDRFTPNFSQTIGTAIIPKRPILSEIGFLVQSQSKTVSIFKGLTKQPRNNRARKTVSISCVDFVNYLYNIPMDSELYSSKRTDEVIEDILTTLGFGSSQYVLDTGLNTPDYIWFDKSVSAGERIKKVCEAEEGYFYADENGILRFENRNHYSVAPHSTSCWNIGPSDVIAWEDDESTPIYNKITVKASPRTVQATQDVWIDSIEEQVDGTGGTLTVWANLDDPVTGITNPVAGTDYTATTSTGGGGSNITADQVVTVTVFATAVKIEITNNNASKAYFYLLKLRGTPATVTGEILKLAEDTNSINKYDEQNLIVESEFIESDTYAQTLATALKNKYKDPVSRIILTIQGVPQLQLRDRVTVTGLKREIIDNSNKTVDTSFGFGEWADKRYRGQVFYCNTTGKLTKIGFYRHKGDEGVKVYMDTVDASNHPANAIGSELYSFDIKNADLIDGYGEYILPTPLTVTGGTKYCFYLASFTGGYVDDYQDLHGKVGVNGGVTEITNTNGVWSTENLCLYYKVFVDVGSDSADYRIMRIQGSLEGFSFIQKLYLRKVTANE